MTLQFDDLIARQENQAEARFYAASLVPAPQRRAILPDDSLPALGRWALYGVLAAMGVLVALAVVL